MILNRLALEVAGSASSARSLMIVFRRSGTKVFEILQREITKQTFSFKIRKTYVILSFALINKEATLHLIIDINRCYKCLFNSSIKSSLYR